MDRLLFGTVHNAVYAGSLLWQTCLNALFQELRFAASANVAPVALARPSSHF